MKKGMLQGLVEISSLALVAGVGLSGCGKNVKGTYADPTGIYVLEVKADSDASLAFMGKSAACNYAVSGNILNLDCHGASGKVAFTIHDDGSLTGPPGTAIPALHKTRS